VRNLHDERDRSPDESIRAEPHSIVNSIRNIIGGSNRDLIIGLLLALSILVNITLIFAYRDQRTQEWVNQYDLTFFKTNDYAALKADVAAHEKLINAWGLKAAVQCPQPEEK
jgi:hypothetical protein